MLQVHLEIWVQFQERVLNPTLWSNLLFCPIVPSGLQRKLFDVSIETNEVEVSYLGSNLISIRNLHGQINLSVGNFYQGFL